MQFYCLKSIVTAGMANTLFLSSLEEKEFNRETQSSFKQQELVVFILLGPDKARSLAVLDHKREDLWACSGHRCQGGRGKDDPIQDGAGPPPV